MMYATRTPDHLFIWRNGQLVYKRWTGGASMIFDPYGLPRTLPKASEKTEPRVSKEPAQ